MAGRAGRRGLDKVFILVAVICIYIYIYICEYFLHVMPPPSPYIVWAGLSTVNTGWHGNCGSME